MEQPGLREMTSQYVRLETRTEPVAIDITKTAVIVVDMQNDFGSVGGMFERAGIDISMIRGVISPTAKVLHAARQAGIKIIYLKMAFRPDLSDLGSADSPNRVRHLAIGVGQPIGRDRQPDLDSGYLEYRHRCGACAPSRR